MHLISLLLYNVSIRLYGFAIGFAALFNAKAKLWVDGRKNQDFSSLPTKHAKGKLIWVHCASLGEFEQARPVIEKMKSEKPDSVIILTFFSPSGYEIRKNYALADAVFYLPLDTAHHASVFIDSIKPDLALFVKYEFWYNYLNQLKRRKIPVALFSAVFRKEQIFFTWYGGFFKNMLSLFDKVFVQNNESQALLQGIGVASQVSFDTRFDRVFQISQNAKTFPLIEKFKGDSQLLIAGSTWKKDEQLLAALINSKVLKNYKYIIAPHNLYQDEIVALQKALQVNVVRLSQLTDENAAATAVIIVDTMGDLSSLYRYGNMAYVGGAFNASVHNVLEPAVYGMSVVFGPNYLKSAEAMELINIGAAFSVSNDDELQNIITKLNSDTAFKQKASASAAMYVKHRLGGVNDICAYISRYI